MVFDGKKSILHIDENIEHDVYITLEKLKKVASLVKIKLLDDELQYYAKELNVVLSWMNSIAQVNTDNVLPMVHGGVCSEAVFSDDIVNDGNIKEQILMNAVSEHDHFVVPKAIDQDN